MSVTKIATSGKLMLTGLNYLEQPLKPTLL